MKALPIQDRALAKRASLIQAAVRAFSTTEYESVTAKMIAIDAGVATGTFYQYFDNKSDILRVVAAERSEFLRQHIVELDLKSRNDLTKARIETKFERILWFVYEFHADAPELYQVLEQRRRNDRVLGQIMRDGENVTKRRILKFVQSFNKPNSKIVANNLFAMGEGIIQRLIFEKSKESPKTTIRIGANMMASYFKT